MTDIGEKFALPTKTIFSTEPRDFGFNSEFGAVKVVQEPPSKAYQTVVVSGSSTATVTIAHNLGFIPLCMVFTELTPGSGKWYNGYAIAGGSETDDVTLLPIGGGTYADSTNLVLKFQNNTASEKTVKYYYFIFGDNGT